MVLVGMCGRGMNMQTQSKMAGRHPGSCRRPPTEGCSPFRANLLGVGLSGDLWLISGLGVPQTEH